MRTKSLEGWNYRKPGQLANIAGASAMKVKKHGVHLLLVVAMVVLMGTTMMRMHLRDGISPPLAGNDHGVTVPLPGTIAHDHYFHCERSQTRTDICHMRGDIRLETHNETKSFVLYAPDAESRTEKVKPYTRKWEEGSMRKVNELTLIANPNHRARKCDVRHKVPGVVFSTGGYTGNLYHEFNDGLVPLFITTQHLRREVVVIISSFHSWWYSKYREVVGEISNYSIVDLERDKRVHCFPEIEAGLHIHGELAVVPTRMPHGETIGSFRALLNRAYTTKSTLTYDPEPEKPRLTIIVRKRTRRLLNLDQVVEMAEQLGFRVRLLSPAPETELKKIFWLLNSTDVLLGVHGAAMTHFLFMRPGTMFIQVVPLGTDWAANEYFGEPAVKLGLRYVPYKIAPEESSLSERYEATDPVLVAPESITRRGWEITKKIYLDGQDVSSKMAATITMSSSFHSLPNRSYQNCPFKNSRKEFASLEALFPISSLITPQNAQHPCPSHNHAQAQRISAIISQSHT